MEPAHAAFLDAWRAQDFHVPRGPWPRPAPPKPLLSSPVQLSLFDMDDEPAAPPAAPQPPSALLTAIIDAAGVGRRRPRDIATVEAAINASIPADVPTFVDEILSVRRDGEDLIARVRVFDGGLVLLTVIGGPEPSVREWEAEGDQRAFHYAAGAWARFDEAVTPAPAEVPAPRRPSPEDVAYVERAILDILPKGWPSYATEVLSVREVKRTGDFGDVYTGRATVATLRLFDGEVGELTLAGSPGAHGYSWKVGKVDKRPFQFDEAAWAWGRVDEPDG
ncbi:hypothetical protein ASG63_16680 [Methylobacterium sp. Leaf94]|uniref:hypothetical protein n=1 Tax=Methylobacterium sp. Leaf94 TaxID=1736250 RepID=UPI0006F91EC6|nr:hypothetical protein [Methylobacterium sp. Leaf94]KQU31128.1 hypothetical protein ASG63_16680 [Methylobacterium sp. Leaf94]